MHLFHVMVKLLCLQDKKIHSDSAATGGHYVLNLRLPVICCFRDLKRWKSLGAKIGSVEDGPWFPSLLMIMLSSSNLPYNALRYYGAK